MYPYASLVDLLSLDIKYGMFFSDYLGQKDKNIAGARRICSPLPRTTCITWSDSFGTCLIISSRVSTERGVRCARQMGMVNEFELAGRSYMLGAVPCVRSVCLNDHSDSRKILVGTSCSEVPAEPLTAQCGTITKIVRGNNTS